MAEEDKQREVWDQFFAPASAFDPNFDPWHSPPAPGHAKQYGGAYYIREEDVDKVSQEQRPFLIEIERRNGIVKFEEIPLMKITLEQDRSVTIPFVQITLAKEGEQDRILTLGPLGLRDYFTALTMEHAREQPIAEPVFEKLALALQIELGETLRHEIYSTIIGTTLMTVRKWYGPRTLLALLKDLKRDLLGTISRSKGDSFAEFVIQTI